MGRLLDHPMMLVVVLVLIILLFGAPKLPGMARSLGQSMRIFKSEVSEMKSDGKTSDSNGVVDGQVVDNTASTDQSTGTSQNRGGSSTPGNQA